MYVLFGLLWEGNARLWRSCDCIREKPRVWESGGRVALEGLSGKRLGVQAGDGWSVGCC